MSAKKQDLSSARWDDVRLFLAVHRYGTFGQAAARLGLDTSTVSRRLAAFEAALGVQLFERTRDGVVATRIGELAVPSAEAMEAALGQLARVASARETDAEGIVRLSVAPGMADVFVAPALVRLRAKHPRLRIELDASVRAIDLTRHEADLALRSVQPRGAELVVTKLASARWVAAASPALVAASGRISARSSPPLLQGWASRWFPSRTSGHEGSPSCVTRSRSSGTRRRGRPTRSGSWDIARCATSRASRPCGTSCWESCAR